MAIIEHCGYYENPLIGVSHEHTSCELMYLITGSVEITVKGEVYLINENDLVLIKSRQHHKTRVKSEREYHRYIGMINPWELRCQLVRPDLFTMLTDTSDEGLIIVRDIDKREHFDKMTDIFNNGANIYEEISAVLDILSLFYEQKKTLHEKPSAAKDRLVDKVRTYIELNFADSIKIADIANDNFISVGYLTHVFKAQTGMSPREYLSHIRCTRAYELIRHTAMKLTDISAATGFCCANDMSRKIREYYGMTPTHIRTGK